MPVGKIILNFENISLEETERVRQEIDVLYQQGFFHFRNGKFIIHRGPDGTMSEIEAHTKRWRHNKPCGKEKALKSTIPNSQTSTTRPSAVGSA